MGHQIVYTDFHGAEAVRKAEELDADLFLMNIKPENLINFQMGNKRRIEGNKTIFNSNVPIVPIINLNEIIQSDCSPLNIF